MGVSVLSDEPGPARALATKDKIDGLMIDRMDRDPRIVTRLLDEPAFTRFVSKLLAKWVYEEPWRAGG